MIMHVSALQMSHCDTERIRLQPAVSLYVTPCIVSGGKVAHPKWWVLTLCCTWLHWTQWNESCNSTHQQDLAEIMNEILQLVARNFSSVNILPGFLPGGIFLKSERNNPTSSKMPPTRWRCIFSGMSWTHLYNISYWKWRRVASPT